MFGSSFCGKRRYISFYDFSLFSDCAFLCIPLLIPNVSEVFNFGFRLWRQIFFHSFLSLRIEFGKIVSFALKFNRISLNLFYKTWSMDNSEIVDIIFLVRSFRRAWKSFTFSDSSRVYWRPSTACFLNFSERLVISSKISSFSNNSRLLRITFFFIIQTFFKDLYFWFQGFVFRIFSF